MEEISREQDFNKILNDHLQVIVFFWADWHEPSKKNGHIYDIVNAMSEKYNKIKFCCAEAEIFPTLCEKYEITVVPTFIGFLNGKITGKVEGAKSSDLIDLIKQISTSTSTSTLRSDNIIQTESLNSKIEKLIKSSPVMLFMNGSPDTPKCGDSRTMVEILKDNRLPFSTFDILTNNDIYEGLKVYSDWPTYPQLYVQGQLVGGLDIVKDMIKSGKPLSESLGISKSQTSSKTETLNDKLKRLIEQDKVMLFMKGSPDTPKCGFSRTMVELLRQQDISFSHFDILTDEDVRSGLKVYSDWPTYPQLYVQGQLVGGLDIVKDMIAQGPLKPQLGLTT